VVGCVADLPLGNDIDEVPSSLTAKKTPESKENDEITVADSDNLSGPRPMDDEGNDAVTPTEEEKETLRRVAGNIPRVAYWLCAVEFAERASYYGVQPLFSNFVNKPMPAEGNGWGATKKGSNDTPGALGLKGPTANAVSQSFSMFVYAFPVFWGWLADSKTGRWSLICWGVLVCGIAHVLMVGAGAPALLQAGKATVPFMLSVYILAIGAGMFPQYCVYA
jgi:dipeptide/tripeptide permease